jgi:hypothetical protein
MSKIIVMYKSELPGCEHTAVLKLNSVACSLQANYTDLAAAAC